MSSDGNYIALVDRNDQRNLFVYETDNGTLIAQGPGDSNRIFDICVYAKNGNNRFVTIGTKTIKFWEVGKTLNVKKGLFG